MRRISFALIVLIACLTLNGCYSWFSEPSVYDAQSYRKMSWAHKPFDEIKARCRHTSLHHTSKWDNYRVQRPMFKSCMDHYGYEYVGDSEVSDNDVPFPKHLGASPTTLQGVQPATSAPINNCAKSSANKNIPNKDIQWDKKSDDDDVNDDADDNRDTDKTEFDDAAQDKSALYR